ncbi:MAG: transposase [Fusobacteriia bacterium 4572_132]|nr:MAG: transposase [Fusobacteriia bacterium 4572_132]
MCRYNPKIDLVFRKLFGSEENKDILLSFINGILEGETVIKDLTLKNPYNLSFYMSGKMTILDIKAEDENGIWYDIEMQISEQGFYGKRALYYWSKVYSDQIEKAEDFRELKKTIGIHLLDFKYFDDDRYIRNIVLKDMETDEIYPELNYEELYFIEMSKFKKKYSEVKTVLDRWITFMNRAYELDKNNIPKELEDEVIKKAIDKLEVMYFNEQEREVYEAERKIKMNRKEELRTAEEKGIKEGKREGIREEKIEIAKNLLKNNVDVQIIITSTGLNIEEIEKLK